MDERIGGQAALTTDPEEARRGQFIKPLESKIATVKQEQGVCAYAVKHGAGMQFAIGTGLLQHIQAPPQLGAHVEETDDATWQEVVMAHRQPAQSWYPALHAIQGALIQSQHVAGERGQRMRGAESKRLGDPLADLRKRGVHGLHAVLAQLVVDRLVADGQRWPGAHSLKAQAPPEIQLALPALQQAQQHTQSQVRQAQFHWAPTFSLEERVLGGRWADQKERVVQIL
jgi:hypothetical protein